MVKSAVKQSSSSADLKTEHVMRKERKRHKGGVHMLHKCVHKEEKRT